MADGPLRTVRIADAGRRRWRVVDAAGESVGYVVELRGGLAWLSPDGTRDEPDGADREFFWRGRPYDSVDEALADLERARRIVRRSNANEET